MNVITSQGWSCPKCQRIWAPHIAACGPCNQGIASWGPNITGVPAWRYPTAATPIFPAYGVSGQDVLPEWRGDLSYSHQDGDTA